MLIGSVVTNQQVIKRDTQAVPIKRVEVFDISGKSLFKTENIGKNDPLSIEQAGTYFLKIQTEKGVLMRKIVKL